MIDLTSVPSEPPEPAKQKPRKKRGDIQAYDEMYGKKAIERIPDNEFYMRELNEASQKQREIYKRDLEKYKGLGKTADEFNCECEYDPKRKEYVK
mmetsp:Transcript_27399/g.31559  ORF Transcript_27399/g.31559 Transcript_27399/m.31559 type:complete len:95 (+) Transcript_27399:1-285(+)